MALGRDLYLSPERVRARAARYPTVAELLGERLDRVLAGDRKRVDAAPLLLRWLEQDGEGSAAMLERLDGGLRRFDDLQPVGWSSWKGALAGADRTTCLSRHSELLFALTFDQWGYEIQAFELAGAAGRLADLAVGVGGEWVLVETSSPGPHEKDWIDRAMEYLTLALSRVESGLTVELKGYESLRSVESGEWAADPTVAVQQLDDLVNEFCRNGDGAD